MNHLPKELKIKRIYVSGAISEVEEWSKQFRIEWNKKLTKAGFSVWDPLLDSKEEGDNLVKTIVHRDIERVLSCDAFLLNAEKKSWGASIELPYAILSKKCIITIYPKDNVPVWLVYHSDYIFKTLDAFIEAYEQKEG